MTDVTVIVTTHERPAWLAECLRSLLLTADETRANVRILVIDDASQDDETRNVVVRRFGVDYVRLPVNVGLASARAVGLELIDTTYLAFFDDDDVAMNSWLPRHLDKIEQGFDVVAGSYIETDAELVRLRTHLLETASFEGLLAGRNPVNDFALIRRSVLRDVTLRPERETAMMFDLWLALAAKGARFTTIAQPTWYRRLHDANMSAGIGERDAQLRRDAIAEHAR